MVAEVGPCRPPHGCRVWTTLDCVGASAPRSRTCGCARLRCSDAALPASPSRDERSRAGPLAIGETLRSVIAIVGGLATAVLWASTLLGSARSARLIGSWSTLGWVMLIGLVVTVPLVVLTSPPVTLTTEQLAYLAAAGIANSAGLLLVYTALR